VEYANLLNQMAILYVQMKKNDQVESLLNKSAATYKKIVTEENPYYAKVITDLGTFYRMNARYSEAEPVLVKALGIRERTLGSTHPDYIRTKEELALLYWKMGSTDKAYEHYKPVMEQTIAFINNYFPPMSEAEKTKYWDITSPRFQRFYNFAISAATTKPAIVEDIYDYQTATKGLLLNATNKIKQSILSSGDQTLIKDYLLWLDKKELLARYYSLTKEELSAQKIDLPALEAEANKIERGLSSKSAAFSSGYSTQKISFKQIRDVLAENEAVVEIIRVHAFDQDFTSESKYIALVLTKTMQQPKMIVMENGGQLETRYAKFYRNAVLQKMNDEYSYDQYWARLDAELVGKKVIYISPDGAYNQINLNTLKKPGADYVINRYDLSILGSSKDLLALKANKTKTVVKNAMLLGFPDYGGTAIAALPGTKVELENVSKILKSGGYQITQFAEKQASERNLKSVKSPALMHIATHGYFLKDTDGAGDAFGITAENAANNPLLRSGLMLANASKTIGGSETNLESNDNGILTAYEAMNLNLENTNLIILSACETGLGDVKNGEGVYGLQRAFLVAGADAMIMSLWKVDDAATQQLMTNFYTNWIKLGNKQKAFKQAQLQLMTKYKEPYYWGAFVMMGQ
jgi:CHAT domain-containing protein